MNMFNIPKAILMYFGMEPAKRIKDPRKIEYNKRIHDLCRILPRLPASALPSYWSCDWESWHQISKFLVRPCYYDLSYMDMTMSCIYDVPVPIRPIAYDKDPNDDQSFIFEAGGQYYLYLLGPEQLTRFEGEGLTDENAVTVGLDMEYKILDEADDGCEKMYYLEREQREKALRLAKETKPDGGEA